MGQLGVGTSIAECNGYATLSKGWLVRCHPLEKEH